MICSTTPRSPARSVHNANLNFPGSSFQFLTPPLVSFINCLDSYWARRGSDLFFCPIQNNNNNNNNNNNLRVDVLRVFCFCLFLFLFFVCLFCLSRNFGEMWKFMQFGSMLNN